MSNLLYDGDWMVSLSNPSMYALGDDYGAFTGNGKLAGYISMSNVSCQRTLLSGNVQFDQIGKYKNNTIEGFRMHDIQLFTNTGSNVVYNMIHQSLNMSNASVETVFEVTSGSSNVRMTHTVTPLRQYPYCMLQTVELEADEGTSINTLDVYHEIYANADISDIEYNNNVIYNEHIYEDKGLYILNAKGRVANVDTTLAGAACYLFEDVDAVRNLGFNSYNDRSRCYQKHRFTMDQPLRFHILSAQMSSFDFKVPLEEVKRILLNIVFKKQAVTDLVQQVKDDNQRMWNQMWGSDVEVLPKDGITEEEGARLQRIKFFARYSLFQIYACLRDAVNTQINPLNLSYVDSNGNIFFDGDIWLTPLLCFLKPSIARTLLEFRYRNLEQALQLASSFGYKGSKFPYKNDVVGYTSVYWDVISPLHVFNNAIINFNAWNYYRVTLDKEWLQNYGFILMRNVADFLTSYIQNVAPNVYTMPNTLGLGNILSDDQAFTIYTAILALKHTIEACYVLGYIPKQEWSVLVLRLSYPVYVSGPNVDVIKYDAGYDGTSSVDVLDNLIALHPYYNGHYFNNYLQRNNSSIQRNLDFYADKLQSEYQQNPLNNLIIASLYAVVAQTDQSRMDTFYEKIDKILDENMVGYWGHMNIANDAKNGNDISLNAAFVLLLVTCVCGLMIRGSTAPSNVVTEQFRIQDTLGTFMPNTWYGVNISGIGREERFVSIGNQTPYNI